ncbi:MAG: [Clostridia bacterium]|nr:[FeFe] hydrogenase H-cluster maturation GTPase HydF [Clostridia bacterium]
MEKTPNSLRTHVTIFGNTNTGKSTLFNALLGQDLSIVSNTSGTTTDTVKKAAELLPYGPIVLMDSAGFNDVSSLGAIREKKARKLLSRTDFAVYTADVGAFNKSDYEKAVLEFKNFNIPHLLVFTKTDLGVGDLENEYPDAVFVSAKENTGIDTLKDILAKRLSKIKVNDEKIISGLVEKGSLVVHVIPIDSEAPKGRLILPQVQTLRDCLDNGIRSIVVRDSELSDTIAELGDRIRLVITDSQAFSYVDKIVPDNVLLTSYSILMARQKGDLKALIEGAYTIDKLKDGSKILIAEACTHNSSHEDIGRVKIPNLLKKKTGKNLHFDYSVHHDFPENLSDYDLVIHCGGCMITSKTMENRIKFAQSANVPITNYGIAIAYLNGILDRAKQIFGL